LLRIENLGERLSLHEESTMEIEIGSRLKYFREKKGLSVYALAQRCGLTRSFISKVEKGQASPSISSLKKITNSLEIPINSLFEDKNSSDIIITNSKQRRIFYNPTSKITYEFLFPNPRSRSIDVYFFRLKPGGKSNFYTHDGEECGSIIQGTMKITIGDKEYILKPGDSIYFKSTIPHKWENGSKEEVLGFWAVSPPSF